MIDINTPEIYIENERIFFTFSILIKFQMTLFLIWTGILSFALTTVFIYRMKRKKQGFRFQTRVTIQFLIISLIPTIPLILITTSLINQSLDTYVSGRFADTLDDSIEVIRAQLVERSNKAMDIISDCIYHDDFSEIYADTSFNYVYLIDRNDESFSVDTILHRGAIVNTRKPVSPDTAMAVLAGEWSNVLDPENELFESYRILNQSSFIQVGMPVRSNIVSTIFDIQSQSDRLGFLFILQEGIIDNDLIYMAGIVLVFILTFTAVFTGRRLSKGITRPIKDLVEGFKSVGEGKLDIKVSTDAKDEIEYLLESFNSMVDDLKSTQDKLVQSEKVAAWREVARQISHEIKNPLTPIQLSLHRIKKKIEVPENNKLSVDESFETIEEEIESLRSIATEFSEFARMPKPNLTETNIGDIVRSASALYEKNNKNARIELDIPDDLPEHNFDPEQMKRVFINLLTNSIDSVKNNEGTIRVTGGIIPMDNGKKEIFIEIADNGCGMDDETVKRIFDPYFTTKSHGTGLGMPIIKRIVEEHGGHISVASKLAWGTKISLRFKLNRQN